MLPCARVEIDSCPSCMATFSGAVAVPKGARLVVVVGCEHDEQGVVERFLVLDPGYEGQRGKQKWNATIEAGVATVCCPIGWRCRSEKTESHLLKHWLCGDPETEYWRGLHANLQANARAACSRAVE